MVRGAGWVFRVVLWLPLQAFDTSFKAFREAYGASLRWALRLSPVFLLIVGGLAVHAAGRALTLGRELIPPMKQGEFGVRLEAPAGTRLEETDRRARRFVEIAMGMPEVEAVSAEVGSEQLSADAGSRGENIAQFNVSLKDRERNAARQDEIMEALRRKVSGMFPDDEITFTLPTLFTFKNALELQIRGDDPNELRRVGQQALERIRGIDGLKDAELSVRAGYPEIIIEFDRDLLAAKDLSPGQVAERLRTEVQGDVATRFNRGGEKVDIRVRSDQAKLSSLNDLRNMSVTDGYPPVSLASVASLRVQEGPSEIRRIDQQQVVVVTANVEGRDLGSVGDEVMARIQGIEKPADYQFLLGGQNRELRTSYRSLMFALALAVFLVYVVMALSIRISLAPGPDHV